MNTHFRIVTLWSLCVLIFHASADVTDERREELRQRVENGELTDGFRTEQQYYAKWIMGLTIEERSALIPIVRQYRNHIPVSDPGSRADWNGLLAYLGDEAAMISNIEEWRRSGMYRLEVERAESGQLPIFLEPELFLEEPHNGFGDTNALSKSFFAASVVLGYLHYNKHYSEDVRDWAGRTEHNRSERGDATPMRKVVRDWYRANERFIRANRYDKVKPGEELPPHHDYLEATGNGGTPVMPAPGRMQSRNNGATENPVPIAYELETTTKLRNIFVILASVFVMIVIAIIYFRNRRFPK